MLVPRTRAGHALRFEGREVAGATVPPPQRVDKGDKQGHGAGLLLLYVRERRVAAGVARVVARVAARFCRDCMGRGSAVYRGAAVNTQCSRVMHVAVRSQI